MTEIMVEDWGAVCAEVVKRVYGRGVVGYDNTGWPVCVHPIDVERIVSGVTLWHGPVPMYHMGIGRYELSYALESKRGWYTWFRLYKGRPTWFLNKDGTRRMGPNSIKRRSELFCGGLPLVILAAFEEEERE